MNNSTQNSVLVDAVVAVHTPDRPVERVVASLVESGLPTLPGAAGRLRITLVCHNTDPGPIQRRIRREHLDRVRFIQFSDGIKSPAGPFNHGISLATGTWISIVGSDDSLENGALARWVGAAERDRSDVLIAPMAHTGGRRIHTPVVRPMRTSNLDPVADRLTYRTAPLGLVRRDLVERLGLSFPNRYATGEDQSFSAQLWFSGARISYGRGLPRYLVHDDANVRVTATPRSVTEDLAFATDLVDSDWFSALDAAKRHAIVTKLIRVHVFGHVALRAEAGSWNADDAKVMAAAVRQLLFAAPRAARPLSVADRMLLDAVIRQTTDPTAMKQHAKARRTFTNPSTWIPRSPTQLLHPEAPLRFMVASALI
ncbi:hypothetical protein B5P43_15435 [Bacillus sp. SRB_336]|nr:hypothetical protein B5P43_15435 [Bacillus sp. SRB_336]